VRPNRLALVAVFSLALIVALPLTAAAAPAFASAPKVNVTPNPSTPGTPAIFSIVCGSSATSATLFGATLGLRDEILMQPVTGPGEFAVTATVPATTSPGLYIVAIRCSNGFSANATLTVGSEPVHAPQTGDGTTSTATDTAAMAAGAGILGLAALLGGALLYKRKLGRWR
jgi:hypothetical protein